jgi:N-acetylglucosamine-6-phosphate deacetylase
LSVAGRMPMSSAAVVRPTVCVGRFLFMPAIVDRRRNGAEGVWMAMNDGRPGLRLGAALHRRQGGGLLLPGTITRRSE